MCNIEIEIREFGCIVTRDGEDLAPETSARTADDLAGIIDALRDEGSIERREYYALREQAASIDWSSGYPVSRVDTDEDDDSDERFDAAADSPCWVATSDGSVLV